MHQEYFDHGYNEPHYIPPHLQQRLNHAPYQYDQNIEDIRGMQPMNRSQSSPGMIAPNNMGPMGPMGPIHPPFNDPHYHNTPYQSDYPIFEQPTQDSYQYQDTRQARVEYGLPFNNNVNNNDKMHRKYNNHNNHNNYVNIQNIKNNNKNSENSENYGISELPVTPPLAIMNSKSFAPAKPVTFDIVDNRHTSVQYQAIQNSRHSHKVLDVTSIDQTKYNTKNNNNNNNNDDNKHKTKNKNKSKNKKRTKNRNNQSMSSLNDGPFQMQHTQSSLTAYHVPSDSNNNNNNNNIKTNYNINININSNYVENVTNNSQSPFGGVNIPPAKAPPKSQSDSQTSDSINSIIKQSSEKEQRMLDAFPMPPFDNLTGNASFDPRVEGQIPVIEESEFKTFVDEMQELQMDPTNDISEILLNDELRDVLPSNILVRNVSEPTTNEEIEKTTQITNQFTQQHHIHTQNMHSYHSHHLHHRQMMDYNININNNNDINSRGFVDYYAGYGGYQYPIPKTPNVIKNNINHHSQFNFNELGSAPGLTHSKTTPMTQLDRELIESRNGIYSNQAQYIQSRQKIPYAQIIFSNNQGASMPKQYNYFYSQKDIPAAIELQVRTYKAEIETMTKEIKNISERTRKYDEMHQDCEKLNTTFEKDKHALHDTLVNLGIDKNKINEINEINETNETEIVASKSNVPIINTIYWEESNLKLCSMIEKLENKNCAVQAAQDVMHRTLDKNKRSLESLLTGVSDERVSLKKDNTHLELTIMDFQDQVNALREDLDKNRHKKYLAIEKKEREKQDERYEKHKQESGDKYPSELMIQQQLIRSQIEFYFSDYNLKRDKRLLEKIIKEPCRGYLDIQTVLSLSRIRQLCNQPIHLKDALFSSPFIHIKSGPLPPPKEQKDSNNNNNNANKKKNLKDCDNLNKTSELNNKGNKSNNKHSKYNKNNSFIILSADPNAMVVDWIGRRKFRAPVEKQFPFRRTVFIYGLPPSADEEYIFTMLNPFGAVTKVKFDWGPDSLDREIMKRMLDKPRVYKLLSRDSSTTQMVYGTEHSRIRYNKRYNNVELKDVLLKKDDNLMKRGKSVDTSQLEQRQRLRTQQQTYLCVWCNKTKNCFDGYYAKLVANLKHSNNDYRCCLQCAAGQAEQQLIKYDKASSINQNDSSLKSLLLGNPPFPIEYAKTALCVFASQRQASKCVYVRSRLAYNGAFATHYHHYSKLKKDIAMNLDPQYKLLRPATKHSKSAYPQARGGKQHKKKQAKKLNAINNNKSSNDDSNDPSIVIDNGDTTVVLAGVPEEQNEDLFINNNNLLKKNVKSRKKTKESFEKYGKNAPVLGSVTTAPVFGGDGIPQIQPHEPTQMGNAEKMSKRKHTPKSIINNK